MGPQEHPPRPRRPTTRPPQPHVLRLLGPLDAFVGPPRTTLRRRPRDHPKRRRSGPVLSESELPARETVTGDPVLRPEFPWRYRSAPTLRWSWWWERRHV